MKSPVVWRSSQCRPAFAQLCALVMAGCSGDSDAKPEEPTGRLPAAADTTTGCQAWREASCRYVSRCDKEGASACAAQYSAIACKSEELAQQCAERIDETKCDQVTSECELHAIAETARAVQGCQAYLASVCASAEACGFAANGQRCTTDARLDCDHAVALTVGYDQCMAELPHVSCASWVPPTSCAGVVVVE